MEINAIEESKTRQFDAALLVTGPAIGNKTLRSLEETLEDREIPVVAISRIHDFIAYEKNNPSARVLLVRSPIPNNTEKEIESYIKSGMFGVWKRRLIKNRFAFAYLLGSYNRFLYGLNWFKYRLGISS
jgi:hypothetical protein